MHVQFRSEKEGGYDEIDFELLGGNGDKERPYVLHTNVQIDGEGGSEGNNNFFFGLILPPIFTPTLFSGMPIN